MSQEGHTAMAAVMLHFGALGPEQFGANRELQAFVSGFRLSCRNGFTFPKVCAPPHTLFNVAVLLSSLTVLGNRQL